MPRNLKFFYMGYQCPHNTYLLARIKTIAWQESVQLHLFDVWGDEETCRKYQVFSPTMLLVNDERRWHGPFTREKVLELLDEDEIEPTSYTVVQSDEVVRGELVPVDYNSSLRTCEPCLNSKDSNLCRGKAEWVQSVLDETGLDHLGYLHLVDGTCVGGAEFLPSERVPYPIPHKSEEAAFLTCSFLSDQTKDFKSHPLEALISDLRSWGYTSLYVVASTTVVFPNGPMSWFQKKGFKDNGKLLVEPLHNAELHFLELRL